MCEVQKEVKIQQSKILTKNQEENGLLSSLGFKTLLSKVPLLCNILFQRYKMNEIGRKFFLAGDKFMAKMHLRQQRFAYNACVPNKKRIKDLKKQEIC